MKQKIDTFAETTPYTSGQIETLFLEKLVHKYDHVFCVMATHARSDIYDDVMKASRSILVKHRQVRREAGHRRPIHDDCHQQREHPRGHSRAHSGGGAHDQGGCHTVSDRVAYQ